MWKRLYSYCGKTVVRWGVCFPVCTLKILSCSTTWFLPWTLSICSQPDFPPVLPRHFSALCLGSCLFVFSLLQVSWPNLFLWELPCFWYFLSLVYLCTAFWVIASVLLPSSVIFSLTVSNMLLKPVHWAFNVSHYSYYFWRVSLLPCPAKSSWSFLVYLFPNCLYLLKQLFAVRIWCVWLFQHARGCFRAVSPPLRPSTFIPHCCY